MFSEALGRSIRYQDVPLPEWVNALKSAGVPTHLASHLKTMAELHVQGRYDRMTDDLVKLTGERPMSMHDFVLRNAEDFVRREGPP